MAANAIKNYALCESHSAQLLTPLHKFRLCDLHAHMRLLQSHSCAQNERQSRTMKSIQSTRIQWDPVLEAVMGDTLSLSALMLMGIRSTYHLAQYSPEELKVIGSKVMTNWNIA